MIQATQRKLREALFFLCKLEREVASQQPTEVSAFYLSAFLSAARSVTFVLEAEEPTTYPEWSRTWRDSISTDEQRLLAAFTTARNRALKRETPIIAEDRLASEERDPYAGLPVEIRFLFDEELTPIADRVFKGRLTPNHSEEEILPLCRQYADLLSGLVTAFLEAHK